MRTFGTTRRAVVSVLWTLAGLTVALPGLAQLLYVTNVGNNSTIEKYAYSGGSLSATGIQFAGTSGLNGPNFLAFSPVPEPAGSVLLGIGGVGHEYDLNMLRL